MNIRERRDAVEGYVREFGRWTVGTRADREDARAELEGHLREAEEVGRLEESLERLGPPKNAARTFAEGRSFVAAPLGRRLIAVLVDYVGLAALVVFYRLSVLSPIPLELHGQRFRTLSDASLFGGLQVIQAWQAFFAFFWRLWTVVASGAAIAGLVLIVFEWRRGSTPGKLLTGLRVASEEGTTPTLFQATVRRLPLLFWSPLTLVDLAFAFRGPRHQRAFEIVAETTVVDVRRTRDSARSVWKRPIGQLFGSPEAAVPEEVSS